MNANIEMKHKLSDQNATKIQFHAIVYNPWRKLVENWDDLQTRSTRFKYWNEQRTI